MPVSWKLYDAYVHLESDEVATLDELKESFRQATLDPAWRPRINVLHDQRRILRVFKSSEAAERMAFVRDCGNKFGIRRWAVIVKGQAPFGMARMAQAWLEPVSSAKFAVFKELEDALAWVSAAWDTW